MQFRRIGMGAALIALLFSGTAWGQKFQKTSMNDWIEKWLGLELVVNTGGFNESARHDYVAEGTNNKHSYTTISTVKGVRDVEDMVVRLDKKNGGDLRWKVITIDTNDQNNMSTSWGKAPMDNITWHGIIGIISPNDRTTTMHPAHDDYAQIWLNGEKVYDNPNWTGGVRVVTTPTKVNLNKGQNILLFKCGESGGADYVNLHFEDTDKDLDIFPTEDEKFFRFVLSVDPQGKMATTWGDLKVE